ncbi:MAG: sulfatase [Cyclobacteriaceae bacterium]|nr:sulfatase [Cyclobacteriaceae bacterium]
MKLVFTGYPISVFISCLIFSSCNISENKEEHKIPPNVLFILADDLGYHDLGATGSSYYETPNIDRLAESSYRFVAGYSASRVCSPARASIMTGKFTARHGITDWIGASAGTVWREHKRHNKLLPAEYVHNLPAADTTIAESFREAGYKTFFAGKWHLGSEGSYPENHGFDINKGGWDKGSPNGGYFSPWENPSLPNKIPGENLSLRLADETVTFIKENKDKPFFAFLSFYAVHGPIQTSQEKWKKYRDKATLNPISENGFVMEQVLPIRTVQDNPIYAGLVDTMDEAVGKVLNVLKKMGLDKNTIVVFTSDNGGVASGDAFATSNLPLRGGKGYQWEGGTRVPYFVYVPWMNNGNLDYTVTGADLYPTLLDLAGIKTKPNQHIDGVSLKPVMEGTLLPDRPLFWHYPHYGNQGGNPSSVIRKGNWKLIHLYEEDSIELYNLEIDPGEKTNVAVQNPQIAQELKSKLNEWLIQQKALLPEADPNYSQDSALIRKNWIETQLWPKLEKERKDMLKEDFEPNADWWGSEVGNN